MSWALLTGNEFEWKCQRFCGKKSGNISQGADELQWSAWRIRSPCKTRAKPVSQGHLLSTLPQTGTHTSNVEPGSHLLRIHLLQKLALHCCQKNHKLLDSEGLLGIKGNMKARALNSSTWCAISPAGLSHWSQCQLISFKAWSHANSVDSMLQTTSSTYFQLLLETLHEPTSPSSRFTLSSPDETSSAFFPLCYPTFLPQHFRAAHGSISTSLKIYP